MRPWHVWQGTHHDGEVLTIEELLRFIQPISALCSGLQYVHDRVCTKSHAGPGQIILLSLGGMSNVPRRLAPSRQSVVESTRDLHSPPPAFFSLFPSEWLAVSQAPRPGRSGRSGYGATVLWKAKTRGQKTSCPGWCQSGT
jgi:hypothetical protein